MSPPPPPHLLVRSLLSLRSSLLSLPPSPPSSSALSLLTATLFPSPSLAGEWSALLKMEAFLAARAAELEAGGERLARGAVEDDLGRVRGEMRRRRRDMERRLEAWATQFAGAGGEGGGKEEGEARGADGSEILDGSLDSSEGEASLSAEGIEQVMQGLLSDRDVREDGNRVENQGKARKGGDVGVLKRNLFGEVVDGAEDAEGEDNPNREDVGGDAEEELAGVDVQLAVEEEGLQEEGLQEDGPQEDGPQEEEAGAAGEEEEDVVLHAPMPLLHAPMPLPPPPPPLAETGCGQDAHSPLMSPPATTNAWLRRGGALDFDLPDLPGAIVDRILTPGAKGGAKAAVLTPDEAAESPPPSPRAALSVPSPIGLSSPLPTSLRVAQPSPLSFLSPPDPGLSPVRGAGGKPPLSPYRKVVEVKEGGGRGGRRRRGKAVTPEAAGQGLA